MYIHTSVRVAFLLILFICVKAQHRRNKIISTVPYPVEEKIQYTWNHNIPCAISACMKRSLGQDDLGPFWANRGKRDPNYFQNHLYAEEPHWILMRRDTIDKDFNEPFFTSRGKREFPEDDDIELYKDFNLNFRDKRDFPEVVESPFFAARGKKPRNIKF